jgi:hypothetical protein
MSLGVGPCYSLDTKLCVFIYVISPTENKERLHRFQFKKLNGAEGKEQYHVEVSNSL